MAALRVDEVENCRQLLEASLRASNQGVHLRFNEQIDTSVPWRPYILDETNAVAWHILTEYVDSDGWIRRMQKAKDVKPKLNLGVALPELLLHNHEDLLGSLNVLGVRVAIIPIDGAELRFSNTVADVIYENHFRMSPAMTTQILDLLLIRCGQAKTNAAKGVSLEVLTAVMLSQVDGFEVSSCGISNRSQQIDIQIHNRNVGGVLGQSAMVIAEAKNWADPPQSSEYAWFVRKMETKWSLCRLGYFVTTDRFTEGFELERQRDSKGSLLVVPLDKSLLPEIWRGITVKDTITRRLETATMNAASQ